MFDQVLTGNASAGGQESRTPKVLSVDFYAIQSLFITCIMVLAVIGNFIVCMVVWKTRSMDTATGIFILSLAVSDLLRGLTVMPFVLVTSVRFGNWGWSQQLCNICGFTNSLFLSASVITLGAVSVDRFLAIVKPLQYHLLMTPRTAQMMLTSVWLIAAVEATAPLIGWSAYRFVHQMSLCTTPWHEDLSYSLCQLVVSIILPLMVLSWCYFYIFRVARRQQKQIFIAAYWVRALERDRANSVDPSRASFASTTGTDYNITGEIFMKVPSPTPCPTPQSPPQTNAPRSEKKAAYTIFIVIGVFVFCIMPKQILCTWARNDHYEHWTTCYVIAVSSLISFANSAANPFVYGILNRRFRKTFIEILTCYPYCAWLHPIRRSSDFEPPYATDGFPRQSRGQSLGSDSIFPSPCTSPRPSNNFFSSPMPPRRACNPPAPKPPKPPPSMPAGDIFTTLTSYSEPDCPTEGSTRTSRKTSLPFNRFSNLLSVSPSEMTPRAEKYRRRSDPAQRYQEREGDSESVISHAEINLPRMSGPKVPPPPTLTGNSLGESLGLSQSTMSSPCSLRSISRRKVSMCVEEEEEEETHNKTDGPTTDE